MGKLFDKSSKYLTISSEDRVLPSPLSSYLLSIKNSVDATSKDKRISSLIFKPAFSTALKIISITSAELFTLGAKPPSSPTFVFKFFDFKIDFNEWKISQPKRKASEKLVAPTGAIINSWISTSLSACEPPLTIFIIGTGNKYSSLFDINLKKSFEEWLDKLFAKAKLAARVALAPILDLFSVPSNSKIALSKAL